MGAGGPWGGWPESRLPIIRSSPCSGGSGDPPVLTSQCPLGSSPVSVGNPPQPCQQTLVLRTSARLPTPWAKGPPTLPRPCSPTKPVCGRGAAGHCSPGPPCPASGRAQSRVDPPGDHLPSWGWEQQQLLKVGFVRTRISGFSGVTQSRTFAWCGTPSQGGGRVHTLLLAPVPPSLLQRFSWADPASSTSEGSRGPWLTNQCTPLWLRHHDWFRMSM